MWNICGLCDIVLCDKDYLGPHSNVRFASDKLMPKGRVFSPKMRRWKDLNLIRTFFPQFQTCWDWLSNIAWHQWSFLFIQTNLTNNQQLLHFPKVLIIVNKQKKQQSSSWELEIEWQKPSPFRYLWLKTNPRTGNKIHYYILNQDFNYFSATTLLHRDDLIKWKYPCQKLTCEQVKWNRK